jgi:hypothetical protein
MGIGEENPVKAGDGNKTPPTKSHAKYLKQDRKRGKTAIFYEPSNNPKTRETFDELIETRCWRRVP